MWYSSFWSEGPKNHRNLKILVSYTPLAVKICLLLWKFFPKIFNFFPKFSIFFQNFHFFPKFSIFFQNFQFFSKIFKKNSKFSEIFKFFKISKITIDFEYFPNIFSSIINNHTSWKFGWQWRSYYDHRQVAVVFDSSNTDCDIIMQPNDRPCLV